MKEVVVESEIWSKKSERKLETEVERLVRHSLEATDKIIAEQKEGGQPSLEECFEQTSSERCRKIIWPNRRISRQ